ncbi:MAG: DUF1003 domain-containing protein [Sphingomicrobium sp.]
MTEKESKSDLDIGNEERRILAEIVRGATTSRDANEVADSHATFGERLSDRVAAIGGSWTFIIIFGLVLISWMLLNTEILAKFDESFDPYPYIFLNLMLSTVAAIQAPIIMMSQNRQSANDRVAAKLDYETNLRAELEILRLHEKIDLKVADRLDGIEEEIARLAVAVEKRGPAN